MKMKWIVLSTGFALFSMFFGSGNLVFPIAVGQESGSNFILGSLGIILTGVIVPFLGVFGMMLYKGDINKFFASFGSKGVFVFSLLALALMGPFGVLARCLTVAHGALQLLFPSLSLPVSSCVMCSFIYLLAVNKNRIIGILGVVLTPFLLLSIGCITFFGLQQEVHDASFVTGWEALKNGFFQGYQTMDLLAAFFFSKFVIKHLYETPHIANDEKVLYKIFCKAAMMGAGILSLVYFALVSLGRVYAPLLADIPPQEMLGKIAMESLGSMAAPFVCMAVVFACMTTAIVLARLFAEFLSNEVFAQKIGNSQALLVTLGIGFLVSTLDFAGIARFLGPVLETVYPALIVLTLFNILGSYRSIRSSHWPFT